jgi:hypothetical protein
MTKAPVRTRREKILALAGLAILFLALLTRAARAETLEAPVGGAAIPFGESRVACTRAAPGGWVVDASGRTARPPAAAPAIGTVVELRVARALSACAQDGVTVRLATTATWPTLDAGAFTLAVDEGRLRGRGRGLAGVTVSWPSDQGLGTDVCGDPKSDAGAQTCTWNVAKTVPALPSASVLRWWPAGAQASTDAVLFTADGKRAAPESFSIVPSRVEIMDLLPQAASVDVSAGVGRVALSHPDAIGGADCGGSKCTIESDALLVQAPPAMVAAVDVKFRLAPHVFYVRKNPPDTQPTVRLSILRCPMSVASGPPLRGIDGVRAVVRVEGACMHDVASLGFFAGSNRADVAQIVSTDDASYAVLELGVVRAPEIVVTAVRGDSDGTVVAMARVETRPAPVVHTTLEIAGYPPIDFIPNNRRAIVHEPHVDGGELALLPVTDVYEASTDHGVTSVKGDVNAVGLVALKFGYRVASLPHPLDTVDLAVLTDALQRGVKEANVPAPFGLTANTAAPLAEVLCSEEHGRIFRIVPGVVLRLPFSARYGCRVILHRERLSPEYGTQKLTLEIEVDKVDNTSRSEAHVTQTIVLRSGGEARVAWIKGIVAPYDRVVVRLSHVADEAHYLGALDIATGEPAVQWTSIFGAGRVRIYATTAIPTGLYRFGTSQTSGVLSLSLGVLSRFTWLDPEGHEGLLGLEAGLMAFGLTGDLSAANQPLTQVGAVAGLGLSIPIANAGSPTQASINLHAWFEQRIAGSGGESGSKQAIIFGPSISLGNVGTTF